MQIKVHTMVDFLNMLLKFFFYCRRLYSDKFIIITIAAIK